MKRNIINTDVVIIGGGAAGCQAAIRAKEIDKNSKIIIVEKAGIKRSGCLAAGVNAINAYLNEGETPKSYVEYVKKDSNGLIREDLTYSIGLRLNKMTETLEKYGLKIRKDENGKYVSRGKRSIKIYGEDIKPILAQKVYESKTEVYNKIIITDLIKKDEKISGCYGFSIENGEFYVFNSKAVIIATGGAAGIYKSNNSGAAKHKMWYSPFNTGAGLYMGIKSGAEMTTFEMRFTALRTKDTISPTGTIAQGIKAEQINANGEKYMEKYQDKSTHMRLWATMNENIEGRGPCYLETKGIDEDTLRKIEEAYLSMSPSIILKLRDEKKNMSKKNIEIYGTEPYINGGHGQAGFWVDDDRKTNIDGLYAAGDVTGGSPKKYVTGCMAEGEIAAEAVIDYIKNIKENTELKEYDFKKMEEQIYNYILDKKDKIKADSLEEELQKVMDEYAGGISSFYKVNNFKLLEAREKIKLIQTKLNRMKADNYFELMQCHEVKERVLIAKIVIEHLLYRKETRWKCYQENMDYPFKDDKNWLKFVNSIYEEDNDNVKIIEREYQKYRVI